jgi:hypothetical protein
VAANECDPNTANNSASVTTTVNPPPTATPTITRTPTATLTSTRTPTPTPDLCAGVVCDALDDCHDVGVCDPLTGECTDPEKPDGTTCTDGDACTRSDTCRQGTCEGANPVVCTALDQCHDAGTCDPASGVCSNPDKPDGTTCTDGQVCTTTDSCQAGACSGADVTRPDVRITRPEQTTIYLNGDVVPLASPTGHPIGAGEFTVCAEATDCSGVSRVEMSMNGRTTTVGGSGPEYCKTYTLFEHQLLNNNVCVTAFDGAAAPNQATACRYYTGVAAGGVGLQ